jgi:hypothetical protein
MLLCDLRDVCSELFPEGGNSREVQYAVVYVDAQDQATWYEACLHSHGRGVALVKVDLTFAIGWNATVVGKVVWQESGAMEGAGRHACPFELLVGVGKVVIGNLLGSEEI